jgi:hypothetical protein
MADDVTTEHHDFKFMREQMLRSTPISFVSKHSTILIISVSIIFQLTLIGKYLDNSILSNYAPEALDANGYTQRATSWKVDGFDSAFGDAFRMPGYPVFILVIEFFFPKYPYLFVRIFQLILLAISAGLIKVALQKFLGLRIAVTLSFVYIILPMWHFVPVLIAESLSAVIVTVLVTKILPWERNSSNIWIAVLIGALIVYATYLKPNHLILLPVVLSYIVFSRLKRKMLTSGVVCLIVGLLLAPWAIYVNVSHPGLNSLTSTSGGNFYVGTGMIIDYNGGELSKSASKWSVGPAENPKDVLVFTDDQGPVERNEMYTEKAAEIWVKRPYAVFRFGIEKVLIAFGLKSNSLFEYSFGAFNLLTFFAGLFLFLSKRHRGIAAATLTTIFLLGVQAFLFQADRRFVIPLLFPFAIIVFGLSLQEIKNSVMCENSIFLRSVRWYRGNQLK